MVEKYSAYSAMTEGKSWGKTELHMMVPEFSTEPQQNLEVFSSQSGEKGAVPGATQGDFNSSKEHKQL